MRRLFSCGAVLLASMLAAGNAEALVITPDSGVLGTTRFQDQMPVTNDTPGVLTEAAALCMCGISTATEKWKAELSGDPSDYDITKNVSGQTYLLVKDGNNFPAWYLFNLTGIGWNGTDTLQLRNFWPQQGAISFVAIYGGTTTTVPEPATLSMLALGFVGLGVARRRRARS